jgi:hypothetical protein
MSPGCDAASGGIGGWAFILPNFVIVAALGALYVYLGDLRPLTAMFYGVSPRRDRIDPALPLPAGFRRKMQIRQKNGLVHPWTGSAQAGSGIKVRRMVYLVRMEAPISGRRASSATLGRRAQLRLYLTA